MPARNAAQAVVKGAEDLAFLDHLSPILAAADFDAFIEMMRSVAGTTSG